MDEAVWTFSRARRPSGRETRNGHAVDLARLGLFEVSGSSISITCGVGLHERAVKSPVMIGAHKERQAFRTALTCRAGMMTSAPDFA
jgi:hypothetical protein